MEDILLRLPSAAAIYRAVLASAHWIRVAACPTFLRRLRDVHDDYPLLLGYIVTPDGQHSTPPHFLRAPFHPPDSGDGVRAAMVRRGDFFLTRVQAHASGRHVVLEDCHGGLLLFSDSGALTVFDPMTHGVSKLDQLPRRAQDHRGRRVCLLPNRGDEPGAFSVMSLLHGNSKEPARLEVYDSCTRAWRVLAGAEIPDRCRMAMIHHGQHSPAMHAGDRIFWKSDDAEDWLLSLDTKTMTFSDVPLPPGMDRWSSTYAVGEAQDGTCCLVHFFKHFSVSYKQMQVWRFVNVAHQMWELERQERLILDSPSAGLGVHQVRAIVGGIVLLCLNNSTTAYHQHIAFRLKSLKVEAEFTCLGLARPFVIE